MSAEPDSAADAPAPASEADGAQKRTKTKAAKGKAKAAKTAPATRKTKAKAASADKPTPRAGTKQALMIELLKRPEGATVEQIAAATGWQHHTIRGAISGALKKKLGLTVEATRTREVGPNKTGAKGSATTYRIVG
jgi:nucleoid-associated protein YgaU